MSCCALSTTTVKGQDGNFLHWSTLWVHLKRVPHCIFGTVLHGDGNRADDSSREFGQCIALSTQSYFLQGVVLVRGRDHDVATICFCLFTFSMQRVSVCRNFEKRVTKCTLLPRPLTADGALMQPHKDRELPLFIEVPHQRINVQPHLPLNQGTSD